MAAIEGGKIEVVSEDGIQGEDAGVRVGRTGPMEGRNRDGSSGKNQSMMLKDENYKTRTISFQLN